MLPSPRPTHREIERAIGDLFAVREPTRDDLVSSALRKGARPRVVETLRALPDRRYRTSRQLWADLSADLR